MKKLWTRWAPGILLAAGLVVVGCEQKDQQGASRGPGDLSQAPRDQGSPMKPAPSAPQGGATSPEQTQPDAAKEQKPEQQQKP